MMSPGKRLPTRRGGGWVVRGGDALCCASPRQEGECVPSTRTRATQASPPIIPALLGVGFLEWCPMKPLGKL